MAIPASLYTSLLGANRGNEDYLQEDPYYLSGLSLAKAGIPQAQDNTQAFLLPILQGLGVGGLIGLGKNRAYNTAFEEARKDPILQALAGESGQASPYAATERPEDWTPEVATRDRVVALMAQEAKREQDLQKLKDAADLERLLKGKGLKETQTGDIVRIPGFAEAAAEEAKLIETAKKQASNLGGGQVSDTQVRALGESKAVVTEALSLAKDLESAGNWAEFSLAKKFTPADIEGIGVRLKNLADRLGRERTGAAMNPEEQKVFDTLVTGGILNVSPKQTSNILTILAKAENQAARDALSVSRANNVGGIDAITDLFPETLNQTSGAISTPPSPGEIFRGSRVLKVTKIR